MVVYNQIGGLEFQSFRVYREEQRIMAAWRSKTK